MIDNLTALGRMMNSYYGHGKNSLTKQFAVVICSTEREVKANKSLE